MSNSVHVWTHEEGLAAGQACLAAALEYLRMGWSVLCLCPPDHVGVGPHHGKGCGAPGKRPVADGGRWKERQESRATETQVRRWWYEHANANVGLALGPVSRLIRLDIEGDAAERRLAEISGGDLPPTLEFTSGNGRGLLYALPDGVEARTGVEGFTDGELRIQGLGAQTVLPPSRHHSGRYYAWLPYRSPRDLPPAPAPGWVLERLQHGGKVNPFTPSDGEVIPAGRIDTTLTSMAGAMRRHGFSVEAIREALAAEIASGRCATEPGKRPYDDSDAERIARSVGRYEQDAYANVSIVRMAATGAETVTAPPVKRIDPADVATIDDLARAGASVRWLWTGWIPLGVLTAIAAPGGTGKTRFCADLVRRIRHGHAWPDGQPLSLPASSLVLWVVADNHHDEMVSLCNAFGIADVVRVNAHPSEPYGGVALETAQDYADLESRIDAVRPVLVVVDTVGNATDKNLSRQEDAKAFYWPLQVIARKYDTAVLCLTHLNATGQFLGRRVLEKVRVALRLEQPDPDAEKRRLEVYKTNSKKPAALGVTMGDRGNEYDDQPPEKAGEAPEPGRRRGRLSYEVNQAMDWLRGQLANGPQRVSFVRDQSGPEGISVGTLYNAMRALKVREYDVEGRKWWELTEE